MEGGNKMHSLIENRLWMSPEDMPSSPKMSRQGGETSTPNLSVWPKLRSLEFSPGSSKQDSGYFSHTPRSADSSGETFDGKCKMCCKLNNQSCVQSTPEIIACSCKKSIHGNQSPDCEFLQTISENNASKEPILSHIRRAAVFYDETMDTSLYTDEMEVDNDISGENHFSLGLTDIGEEKSIDFVESGIYLSLITPTETCKIQEKTKQTDVLQEGDFDSEEFFSPELDVFKYGETCSDVKESSTKIRKSTNFHTAAKKITIINKVLKSFSLNGIDRVDFVFQLSVKKNCPHIVNKIFSFLSEKDLDCVRVVSKTWNEAFNNDFPAYSRWKSYRLTILMGKENSTSPKKAGSSGGRSQGRSMLSPLNITNQLLPRHSARALELSPPVSPKSARFQSFQKAAKALKSEQDRLLQCPKCYYASVDQGSPTAKCCRSGCRHRFCVWCRNEVKADSKHTCPPLYTPRMRRDAHKIPSIGSKICKRNLRRLI